MSDLPETVSRAQAVEAVQAMATITARLHYHYAKALVDKYGDEGREMVLQIMREFGAERGRLIRQKALAQGLEPMMVNYYKVTDLPMSGWKHETLESTPTRMRFKATYCPFAEVWKALGAPELGLLYCEEDKTKFEAYMPGTELTRLSSILEGADCCEMLVVKK